MYISPNRVIIDLNAIRHNFNVVKSLVKDGVSIMGVVKSDAYGHGMVEVSKTLMEEGVDFLGVAHVKEAIHLREAGVNRPIVLLCGFNTRDEAQEIIRHGIISVIYDMERAWILNNECEISREHADILIKVDTGMGRLGVMMDDAPEFLKGLLQFRRLKIKGIMSHFPSADEEDESFTREQIKRFEGIVRELRAMGSKMDMNSLSNSAGIMRYRGADFDVVRPGIMLYGGLPDPGFKAPVKLMPAMHLLGRVLQVKRLPSGHPVGYGRSYYTGGEERIAVLSVGYGDGIPRSISNKGEVIIKGRRYPIVGRVSMNLTMARINQNDDVKEGDEVVFLGAQGDEVITGDDMADWSDTISYEIYCSIGCGKDREYLR